MTDEQIHVCHMMDTIEAALETAMQPNAFTLDPEKAIAQTAHLLHKFSPEGAKFSVYAHPDGEQIFIEPINQIAADFLNELQLQPADPSRR